MTDVVKPTDTVKLTIDGIEVEAEKGELVIRVAERIGIAIPRFCDHPLLEPAGACRQCLVDIEGQRKPSASCTQTVADGMVVRTQLTSQVARKAQEGIMEFLLINHPLDCPMCDKGGECPLQNQALSNGRSESRFHEHKREYPKPIPISSQVLLDRERCVLCQRCTRFSDEIAGDRFIDLMERGADEQIGVFTGRIDVDAGEIVGDTGLEGARGAGKLDEPFNSYFSGNTVQICPVGALTGAQYRFRARPFDLVSTPNVCEHCSAGCAQRSDHRRGKVLRRLAGDDPAVNEEWNCDKGRWAFQYATAFDRITEPMVRDRRSGELRKASWPEALSAAAEGLRKARDEGGVGVLAGGRLTVEDAYTYGKFARTVLGTNDVDFRARPLSTEETEFLGSTVAGRFPVTYSDVEAAPAVVLVGFEPEEECPILFLRMRKAVRKTGLRVISIAPFASRGLGKLNGVLLPTVPGAEATALTEAAVIRAALSAPGAILFVGERLATVQGGLTAAARMAAETGAKLAWVPRRAGDRGALDAGCLPTLLPGGRPVAEAAARDEVAKAWGVGDLPTAPGRDTDAILAAAHAGEIKGLVVGGVDPHDLADPRFAEEALDNVEFLVSLELRLSAVSRRADVVLPIAPAVEKSGSYLNWEGRVRPFDVVLRTSAMTDARVLDSIAREMGEQLGCQDVLAILRQIAAIGETRAPRAAVPSVSPATLDEPAPAEARLATWSQVIDLGALQDGDENLAGTARTPVAHLGKATAASLGVADGDPVRVSTGDGAITLPALIVDGMMTGVVWLPSNSPGSTVRRTIGANHGDVVRVSAGSTGGPILAQGGHS
jgi:NADH-quinone oxidoreductase subunit G